VSATSAAATPISPSCSHRPALPADHLAWFLRDVVDQLDLEPFLRAYRADGHGHPDYDAKTLRCALLYGYASALAPHHQSTGNRGDQRLNQGSDRRSPL
jgi:hypothetical protein